MTVELDFDTSLLLNSWDNVKVAANATWNYHEVVQLDLPTEPFDSGIPSHDYSLNNRQVVELSLKTGDVEAKNNSDGWFKKLWKKHKVAIIVTAAVVTAVTVTVVVVVATAGTGTAAATSIASGAAYVAKKAISSPTNANIPPPPDSSKGPQTPSSPCDYPPNRIETPSIPSFEPSQNPYPVNPFMQPTHTNPYDSRPPVRPDKPLDPFDYKPTNPNQPIYVPSGPFTPKPEGPFSERLDASNPFLRPGDHVPFSTHEQSVQAYTTAIALNPNSPLPYLDRGIAHFHLGKFEQCLADFNQYASKVEQKSSGNALLGYLQGLHKGTFEACKGMLFTLVEQTANPGLAAYHAFEGFSHLVQFVKTHGIKNIGQVLVPELCHLTNEWDHMTLNQRGESIGFIIGKYGTEVYLLEGANELAYIFAKTPGELTAINMHLYRAEQLNLLEAAAGIGNPTKIAQAIQRGEQMAFYAEELGMSAQEMRQLHKTGQLETAITQKYKHLSLSKQESIDLFAKSETSLKPHRGKYMSESEVRALIHEQGLPTLSRPQGIPENYRITVSKDGGGIKYVHPNNEQTYIRVMPGKPHSPNPLQQRPYVVQMKDGKTLDKFGNPVSGSATEAHIPYEEFVVKRELFGSNG